MLYVSIAFLVSAVITLLTLRYGHLHAKYTADSDMTGVQKYHARPVPRVGGIALVVAMLVVAGAAAWREPTLLKPLLLLLAGMPAFLGGLAEDLTKRVRALVRLLLAMLAGALGYYLLDTAVVRLDIRRGLAAAVLGDFAGLHHDRRGRRGHRHQHHRRIQRPCRRRIGHDPGRYGIRVVLPGGSPAGGGVRRDDGRHRRVSELPAWEHGVTRLLTQILRK